MVTGTLNSFSMSVLLLRGQMIARRLRDGSMSDVRCRVPKPRLFSLLPCGVSSGKLSSHPF